MRNIKLTIAYDGTNYYGWQSQKKKKTVQRALESALKKTLSQKVKTIASGRTDRGVHALAQVVNFKTSSKMPPGSIYRALNFWLPDDISCLKAENVNSGFHARFKAKSKVYRYLILNSSAKPLFLKRHACLITSGLNTDLMRRELNSLTGRHDFKSFSKAQPRLRARLRDTVRTIKRIDLRVIKSSRFFKISEDFRLISIEIEADGFLHHMVRNIVGTAIEAGRGRFKKGDMRRILACKDRRKAGPTAPAKGLYLARVKY